MMTKSTEKSLYTNNSRKRAGFPLRRKADRRKRYFTRREVDETINEFLRFCNQK